MPISSTIRRPTPRLLSRPSAILVAAGLALSSLWSVPLAAERTSEAEDFRVRQQRLELPEGSIGEAQIATRSREAQVLELEGSPTMVILRPERAGRFAVRSLDPSGWSPWVDLASDEDEAPDGLPGQEGFEGVGSSRPRGLGPVWIGDATHLEVRSLDGATTMEVETLESLESEELDNNRASLGAGDEDSGLVLPSQPTIQPRANWTTRGFAVENEGCEDGPVLSDNIRAAVVHHTVTGNSYSQADVDDQLRAIYRLHVDINGWCDIAYNFVIDRFGTIWEARTGGIDQPVRGGHAKGFNTWTVGIALLGQHQAGASPSPSSPTSATIASLERLVGWKLGLHGVDPNGTTWLRNQSSDGIMKFPSQAWVEVPTVLGHRDLGVTSCPGSHTMPHLGPITAGLAHGRVGDPPYSFVAHQPYEHGPGMVVVDTVGGLRPAGSASQPFGELVPDSTTAIAVDGGPDGGYVLTSGGVLVDYGSAPTVSQSPAGSAAPVDLVVTSDGRSGWVLDIRGSIHSFGNAPDVAAATSVLGQPVALSLDDSGRGYILSDSGGLAPVGGAPDQRTSPGGSAPVAFDLLADGRGGWMLMANGQLSPFGSAPDWQVAGAGSIDARAVLAAENGRGGWVVDSEGRLHRFGEERPILPISTTVGTPTVVDGALVDWVADETSELIRFVNALTELFLGQSVDPLDADWMANRVVFENRAQVVDELAHSDQWAGSVVDQLYLDVLGREPEESGRRYWIERLANGLRTQDLGASFYSSPEYVAASGDASGFVTRLYRALLDREPDQPGLSYWVDRLESGQARPSDITVGFYQSPESRLGRVDDLYARILQRAPDPEGRQYWANQLWVIDDIELAVELAASAEYYFLTTEDE